ncbi:hypothetical protein GQX74_008463 [Glossina fuscipes]|nr:hypothetical protein GQX74_008463 [Glossina fuscipes]
MLEIEIDCRIDCFLNKVLKQNNSLQCEFLKRSETNHCRQSLPKRPEVKIREDHNPQSSIESDSSSSSSSNNR